MTYVSRKLSSSVILRGDGLLLVNGCDDLLNQQLFESTDFVKNLDIIVVQLFKFIRCNACGIFGY